MTIINKLRKKFPGAWKWDRSGEWWEFEDGRHVIEILHCSGVRVGSYRTRRYLWVGESRNDYFTL